MKITKLEPSQHVKERWLCYLEDGSLLRVTENEVVAFGLYAGMELSPARLGELQRSAGESKVKSKALDLIAHKPMSRKELVDKLTAKPPRKRDGTEREPVATPEQAHEVADWLEDLGYLNDAEYARTVAQHYSAKGYGERKVQDELFRRGVPRQYWPEAMEEAGEPEEGIDAFLEKRFRGRTPDQKELKRASDALARRGYRWNEIREGLNRYGANIEEE
ncbi:MAG: RecX family transcriptional regulator [Oscillospiraceae bacterium]|nr:RecX family transcriptional regulator [Oscillospiraceae bacterium]